MHYLILDGAFIFIIGLLCGSFLNTCITRLPKKESIIFPPSRCPSCKHKIKWWENIPLLSYILLSGKCRYCGEDIPVRYILVEFLTALIYLFLWVKFGFSLKFIISAFFISMLVVITFIDLEHKLILNVVTYPGVILGVLLSSSLGCSIVESALGVLMGGGILYLIAVLSPYILGREGMGFGDVKLGSMIGAYLGWRNVLFVLFIASLSGALIGTFLILIRKKRRKDYIPFAPFLSSGALLSLIGNYGIF
jgi:leader peptidase (prepilin peptidase)/N-methyltransferase